MAISMVGRQQERIDIQRVNGGETMYTLKTDRPKLNQNFHLTSYGHPPFHRSIMTNSKLLFALDGMTVEFGTVPNVRPLWHCVAAFFVTTYHTSSVTDESDVLCVNIVVPSDGLNRSDAERSEISIVFDDDDDNVK